MHGNPRRPPAGPSEAGLGRAAGPRELGRLGEEFAARHLRSLGMRILDRNWRCPAGEIDIVARCGAKLVVCEVKTRSGTRYGSPLEAVDARRVARLRRLGALWRAERSVRGRLRIDVIGLLTDPGGGVRVRHVRGIG
ncbi:putative endonuclease [Allonocardiopsis opalescens]|uniref:UPF0102 protein CLV72_109227 n=2 Tax=Allonocardiopsis opalescens TaxID=1144618 RepID=A0A2T0PW86_9ACTN|nr:putative endonuclease [Allonocardiopsis opalescens]